MRPVHTLGDRLRFAGKRMHDWGVKARQAILGVSGVGCVDYAVFDMLGRGWGFLAVGLSLLLFQWLNEGGK